MSQKKQNSKPRKPIVPSDEEITNHRRRRQANLETHASAIQDYSDIDQGILRLEEQIAWSLRDTDQYNYLTSLVRAWEEQLQAADPHHAPLSTRVLGIEYTPDAAATATLPQPLEVTKLALMCSDRLSRYKRRTIEGYIVACLDEFTEYCNQGGRLVFSDVDDTNAVLVLALSAQFLQLTRERRSFADYQTCSWLDAFLAYIDQQSYVGCYGYMVCASILHALGPTAQPHESEFSLRLKMQVIYIMLASALGDPDCVQLFLDPHARSVFVPWLHLYTLCWHNLPADTRKSLLTDYAFECQFSLLDLCALILQDKVAHVCAVQYRKGDTGEI